MQSLEVDGEEKVLKKVCRKNYNKKGEFTGNVTDYYINDIPKKQADFDSFLEECACDKNRFSLCINAMTLLLKGGTEQRAILADMFGQHSNDDICNQFPEFEELRAILQDGTVDELKKRCNTQLYGQVPSHTTLQILLWISALSCSNHNQAYYISLTFNSLSSLLRNIINWLSICGILQVSRLSVSSTMIGNSTPHRF
jgi:hypothetical protein